MTSGSGSVARICTRDVLSTSTTNANTASDNPHPSSVGHHRAGLEDISSGDLVIGGRRVNEKAPRDRNLAMVFQNYALYPHLTVFENIAFPLRLNGQYSDREIRDRVLDVATTLELQEHLERKPANLSGGQRQRVAMGRAIVRHADAFLFDEPLSNLDAKLRGQMRTEILRLQRRLGMTTVYVTHDQTGAMTLGDRRGPEERRPATGRHTARALRTAAQPVRRRFIGSPPMNFIPGTVRDGLLELPFTIMPIPSQFNGRLRDELLNSLRYDSLPEARVIMERWRIDYANRPHSAHDELAPSEFAQQWTACQSQVAERHADHQRAAPPRL